MIQTKINKDGFMVALPAIVINTIITLLSISLFYSTSAEMVHILTIAVFILAYFSVDVSIDAIRYYDKTDEIGCQ